MVLYLYPERAKVRGRVVCGPTEREEGVQDPAEAAGTGQGQGQQVPPK